MIEETTDERADRRRLSKIVERLAAKPGDLPVELIVHTRAGGMERLRLRTGVAPDDDLVPQLQGLLGVLGEARAVGASEDALTVATANAG
jgi:hypothetical protein